MNRPIDGLNHQLCATGVGEQLREKSPAVPRRILQAPSLLKHSKHAFSLKGGGGLGFEGFNQGDCVGDDPKRVAQNRQDLKSLLDLQSLPLLTLRQIHTDHIFWITRQTGKALEGVTKLHPEALTADALLGQADALISDEPGFVLGVFTADCAPVLISNGEAVVAAIHSGWRSTAKGIVSKVIRLMTGHLGVDPGQLNVAIGPCIGFDSFEVGPEVVASLKEGLELDLPTLARVTRAGEGDRFFVDLQGIILQQCHKQGVRRVECLSHCTVSNPKDFYSYRRDKGVTGRHLNLIVSDVPTPEGS